MLRRICNNPSCGKVLEGEPPITKEDPDACLIVGGEVVLIYEDLCPECIERLKVAVKTFEDKPKVVTTTLPAGKTTSASTGYSNVELSVPANNLPNDGVVFVNDAQEAEPNANVEPAVDENPAAKPAKTELANQVVKQYPIPKRSASS